MFFRKTIAAEMILRSRFPIVLSFALATLPGLLTAQDDPPAEAPDLSHIQAEVLLAAEYFIGLVDPGLGNGVPLAAADGEWMEAAERLTRTNLSWQENSAPTVMNVRVLSSDSIWGPTFKKVIWPEGSQYAENLIAEGDTVWICPNDSIEINYAGPDSYVPTWWDGTSGASCEASPVASSWFVVSATDGLDTIVDSVYVKIKDVQAIPTEPSGLFFVCPQSPAFIIEATGLFTDWQWSLNGAPLTSETDSSIGVIQAGNYQVTAVELETGCQSHSNQVVVTGAPQVVWSCDENLGGVLSVDSIVQSSQTSFTWSFDGDTISESAYAHESGPGVYSVQLITSSCSLSLSYELSQSAIDACPTGCSDSDMNGVCDVDEQFGCMHDQACNFNPDADIDDDSCTWPLSGFDCDGNCLSDADEDGVCDEDEPSGCSNSDALNFDPSAELDDGSCEYVLAQLETCECFFGSDPGFGAGVALLPDEGSWGEAFGRAFLNASNLLEDGLNVFSVRCKGENNEWGDTFKKVVFGSGTAQASDSLDVVETGSVAVPQLLEGEYFFGIFDPGEGQGAQFNPVDGDMDEVVERLLREQLTWDELVAPTIFNVRVRQLHLGNSEWGELFRKVIWPNGEVNNAQLINPDTVSVCSEEELTLDYQGPLSHLPTWPDGSNNSSWSMDAMESQWVVLSASDGQSTYWDSVYIETISLPSSVTIPSGVILGCPSQPLISLTAVETDADYEWYKDGQLVGANSTLAVTALGEYTLNVEDPQTGCSSTSEPVVVAFQPQIALNCADDFGWTLSLGTAATSSNAAVVWFLDGDTIATTPNLHNPQAGLYSVVVETSYCSGSDELNVTELMLAEGCLAGCTDTSACNFSPFADIADGSCDYESCVGDCTVDTDGDGVCDEDEVGGCTDPQACNYSPLATDDLGNCIFPTAGFDCNGGCLDTDLDGVCDFDESPGCTDVGASNYSPTATDDDGSCDWLSSRIVEVEYFIGEDPGEGEGTSLLAIDENWADLLERVAGQMQVSMSVDSVSLLSVRALGSDGQWGSVFQKAIWGYPNSVTESDTTGSFGGVQGGNPSIEVDSIPQLVAAEYFVGIFDPGVGQGIPMGLVDGGFDEQVERLLKTQFLWNFNDGPTLINIRTQSSDGTWSALFRQAIWSEGTNETSNLIAQGDSIVICYGDTVTLDFTGPNTFTPTWFDGSSGDSVQVVPEASGNFVVSSTDGVGLLFDTIYIEVNDLPFITTVPSGVVGSCAGQAPFEILASSLDGSYVWYDDMEPVWFDSSYTVTKSGQYHVEVTDAITGCSNMSPVVAVLDSLNPELTCQPNLGWTMSFGTLDSSSNASVEWFDANTLEIITSSSYMIPDGPGEYWVIVSNEFCSDSALFTLSAENFAGGCSISILPGCTDPTACNYNPSATMDDGSCLQLDATGICGGDCELDEDEDGICDVDEVFGCMDIAACNFESTATENNGCIYATFGWDCDGNCLLDLDEDGVCDVIEVLGCQDSLACNFDSSATDAGYCTYPNWGEDCDGNCLNDVNSDGVCDVSQTIGCMDPDACNFNAIATINSDCYFPPFAYDCSGNCLNDSNSNGICDEIESIVPCVGPECCGENSMWDPVSLSCVTNGPDLCGDFSTWDEATQTCVGFDDCPSDVNGNGIIDMGDLLDVLAAFGQTCSE